MTIGGTDVILAAPRATFDTRRILEVVQQEWPTAVFEDAESDRTSPVRDLVAAPDVPDSREFFLYQDEASARSWDEEGLTSANANTMIHVLIRDIPTSSDDVELTFVVDHLEGKMATLIRRLRETLKARDRAG
jgi:hypothetical protein